MEVRAEAPHALALVDYVQVTERAQLGAGEGHSGPGGVDMDPEVGVIFGWEVEGFSFTKLGSGIWGG